MQSTFDERNWLIWLVRARIFILTLLLAIELAVAQFSPGPVPMRLFITTILLWYSLSLFYVLLLSFWQEHRLQASLQVVTDLIMVSLVVHETGGWDSSLNFLYPLVIIVASVLLPRVWAQLVAALAFILYGTVLELNYYAVVPSYCTTHPGTKALQAIIFVNLFAFLAVAYLAGLLTSKLRQVGVQLKDTSGALESLQALHENIIHSISSGLITTGLDGRITLVNAAAQRLLERSPAELLGAPVHELFLDPLPTVESPQAHGEVRFEPPTKFRKTVRVRAAALTVPERGDLGYVYVLDDLTEIRRLEREVRMQDKLAAVGRLAAAIAHEIRNPLTSIAGSVSMLSGVPEMNEDHRRLLDIVTRESQRLNSIITDFLAYSRTKQYHFDRVDLIQSVEDTLTLMDHRMTAEKTGITIDRRFTVRQAWAIADGDKLKQVFWNLCENAVRAMKNGGTLTAAVESLGDDWQVSFIDTGTGMTPQQIEKLFEPFQSNFEGGTGLGLAIVYQIVQAHEGKVWARSKPGQGTTLVLRLRHLDAERAASAERMLIAGRTNLGRWERRGPLRLLPEEVCVANILVCDDERSICEMLDISLRREGHRVETVQAGQTAKNKIDGALYDVIITDIKMPNIDGIEVLRHAHRVSPDSAVILITAVDDYEAAVQAVKAGGATDYIRKSPGLVDEIKLAINRAVEKLNLSKQNFALRRDAATRNSLDNIIGSSGAMEKLKQTVRTVASTASTVLIHGESGTGKELVARAVHVCSPRATDAFVSVNCGAFPETLLESELFGYLKGAFTGANQNKRGLFEVADGGTIFLDEISEMTMAMQVKLLRVLQERTVRPVGSASEISIDVRVIAATNRDLDKAVAENVFREDLYYRLNVIPIRVPPLRERREDIPLLANHFLKKYASAAGRSILRVNAPSLDSLCGYEWPGNVRQLENTVERAVALETTEELHVELPAERPKARAAAASGDGGTLPEVGSAVTLPEGIGMETYVAGIERSLLQTALNQSGGVQTKAADVLGISYRSFRHLMKKYGL